MKKLSVTICFFIVIVIFSCKSSLKLNCYYYNSYLILEKIILYDDNTFIYHYSAPINSINGQYKGKYVFIRKNRISLVGIETTTKDTLDIYLKVAGNHLFRRDSTWALKKNKLSQFKHLESCQ